MRQIKHLRRNHLIFPFVSVYASCRGSQGHIERVITWLRASTSRERFLLKTSKEKRGDIMAQEMVRRVCKHCATAYTAFGGNAIAHCVQCFSCEQYKPFTAMYGRVGGMGYCCRECESREHVSTHLFFEMVLNLPGAIYSRI